MLLSTLPLPKTPERKIRTVKRTSNVLTSTENIQMLRENLGKKQRIAEERLMKERSVIAKKEEVMSKMALKILEKEERQKENLGKKQRIIQEKSKKVSAAVKKIKREKL